MLIAKKDRLRPLLAESERTPALQVEERTHSVARLQEKIANKRNDLLHKALTEIVKNDDANGLDIPQEKNR